MDEPASIYNGVSDFGGDVISEMNRLGIIIDISHVSKKAMLDAIRLSKSPVIASHSSCRALCDHSRNLDDEQLSALKENGGVINIVGINMYIKKDSPEKIEEVKKLRKEFKYSGDNDTFFSELLSSTADVQEAYQKKLNELHQKYPLPNVKDYVDHIDYAVKYIGIDHVGISSDFFDESYCIENWKHAGENSNITLELVRRGYTEKEIAKLWSGNILRVWEEVELVAQKLQKTPDK